MTQKDQYIYKNGRFVKISGGKVDVQIVSELPTNPVEGTIYLLEDTSVREIIDIDDGITEEIRDKVVENPESLLRYNEYIYVPNFKSDDRELPTYYTSFVVDEQLAYYIQIDWEILEINDEASYEVATQNALNNLQFIVNSTGTIQTSTLPAIAVPALTNTQLSQLLTSFSQGKICHIKTEDEHMLVNQSDSVNHEIKFWYHNYYLTYTLEGDNVVVSYVLLQ